MCLGSAGVKFVLLGLVAAGITIVGGVTELAEVAAEETEASTGSDDKITESQETFVDTSDNPLTGRMFPVKGRITSDAVLALT